MEHGEQLAPENSRGSAKKLRANTSNARWRAWWGNRSRSSTSAALTPSNSRKVPGKSTRSRSSAPFTSTAARSRRRNVGLRATKPSTLHGGVRGTRAKESVGPPANVNG
ncbi:hypothetical protein [Tessaracoccus coleopterorum]|uniref:hypothetical protein n=1 Tax=Tessaracoccus coleopterorum TaxID=2714950 RepID=UPI0018D299EA|nr:hypothetical protein [Tessaracoccus coleopterorum]